MDSSTPTKKRAGWVGTTRETMENGAMLGGKWWKAGDEIACIFQRTFPTKYGEGHEFLLVKPQTVTVFVDEFGSTYKKQPEDNTVGQDRQINRFSLPPLAGFDMAVQALQAAGFPGFRFGDRTSIKCIAVQTATEFGYSDMPEFEVSVDPR